MKDEDGRGMERLSICCKKVHCMSRQYVQPRNPKSAQKGRTRPRLIFRGRADAGADGKGVGRKKRQRSGVERNIPDTTQESRRAQGGAAPPCSGAALGGAPPNSEGNATSRRRPRAGASVLAYVAVRWWASR